MTPQADRTSECEGAFEKSVGWIDENAVDPYEAAELRRRARYALRRCKDGYSVIFPGGFAVA